MDTEEAGRALFNAWREGSQPSLPSQFDPAPDESQAYGIQQSYVRQRLGADRIAGYKVGATAEPVRAALGISDPLTGALFESGLRISGEPVQNSDFKSLSHV